MNYTNHTGGAKGSDTAWEILSKKYNIETISYSFKNHHSLSSNNKI
jgi:hypothetical protein